MNDIDDIYAINNEDEISLNTMQKATQQDEVLSKIMKFLKKGRKPDKEERKSLTWDGMTYAHLFECLSSEDRLLNF